MVLWIRDLSLKYKFWALNMVTFVTTLLLVLFALQLEQQSRSLDAQTEAQALASVLQSWPEGGAFPQKSSWVALSPGQKLTIDQRSITAGDGWTEVDHDRFLATTPVVGVQWITRTAGEKLAVLARAPSVWQLLIEHFFSYALAVAVLMVALDPQRRSRFLATWREIVSPGAP